MTSLFEATTVAEVESLLAMEANIDAVQNNKTPLGVACYKQNLEVVECLLKHGANPFPKDCGNLPGHYVAESDNIALIDIFRQQLGDWWFRDRVEAGCFPLYEAIRENHQKMVVYLLQHGADPFQLDSLTKNTALVLACIEEDLLVVRAILFYAKDKEELCNWTNREGYNALYYAINSSEIVRTLFEHGAKIAVKNSYSYSPLHWAARDGRSRTVRVLLQHGADPSAKDSFGNTPLHYACMNRHTEVARLLLVMGARNEPNEKGDTPLQLAERRKDEAILDLFARKEKGPTFFSDGMDDIMHIFSS